MRLWTVWALAVALCACEVPPCPKDRTLTAADTPCECEGAIVDDVACGGVSCTAFGLFATTTAGDCDTAATTSPNASR